jgi:hypothetical protein
VCSTDQSRLWPPPPLHTSAHPNCGACAPPSDVAVIQVLGWRCRDSTCRTADAGLFRGRLPVSMSGLKSMCARLKHRLLMIPNLGHLGRLGLMYALRCLHFRQVQRSICALRRSIVLVTKSRLSLLIQVEAQVLDLGASFLH